MTARPAGRLAARIARIAIAALASSTSGAAHAEGGAPTEGVGRAEMVFSKPLADATLAAKRARDNVQEKTEVFNTISMQGTAEHVSVNNSITGGNNIGGGSFAGAHGFPIVIQNSGNGVLIQNATILNVTVKP
jgi:hypothetical protein